MVGIIYIAELWNCPFAQRYIDELERQQKDYKIIIWNRESVSSKRNVDSSKVIEFSYRQDRRKGKIKKIRGFCKYRKFIIEQINNYHFEKLIILCTLTGILIEKLLRTEYKEKYIMDIRDTSYEYLKLFKKIEKRVIDNSSVTVYSSKGFLDVLPESDKYVFCPNLTKNDIEKALKNNYVFHKKENGEIINFVYVGAVRQYENVKGVLDKLGNDPRFEVFYHGSGDDGYQDMIKYSGNKGYKNVHFTGRYSNIEKPGLLHKADLLNSFYQDTYDMRFANTNKYFDSIVYHIPIICNSRTYEGRLCVEEGIGIAFDGTIDGDKLCEAYELLDEHKFNENCCRLLEQYLDAELLVEEKIRDFLRN